MTDSPHKTTAPGENGSEIDLTGETLGDYRVLRRLGRGAMAEVYLAEQLSLRRRVALKVLKRHLAQTADYVERFEREARSAAALVHGNIVQIYEVGHLEGVHFIAQEYVQGTNLSDFIVRQGTPDFRQGLSIMRQVASALKKSAEAGIVHRDIKPENILLASTGEVKVADFGLSRMMEDGQVNLTRVGVTMGTPLYMSPEQVEGRPLDPRSDIYSLGVTCFHMFTGQPPFKGDTALAVAVQHLKAQPDRIEVLRPDLPPEFCRIIQRMLSKSPAQRQTAGALLKELRTLAASVEGFDDDAFWQEDLDPREAASTSVLAATQRLAAISTEELKVQLNAPSRWLGAGLIAAALLAGVGLRFAFREPFLLAGVGDKATGVKKLENVEMQVSYAQMFADPKLAENAWLSVINYFPEARWVSYHRQAKQQLALLYLQEARYEESLALFQELAKLEEAEKNLRSFGLAGMTVVYDLQGKKDDAVKAFEDWFPLYTDLADPTLFECMRQWSRANRRLLNDERADKLEELFRVDEPADVAPSGSRAGNSS